MTFDLIHMVHVLYHINLVELENTFMKYYQSLSPGGLMFITYESGNGAFKIHAFFFFFFKVIVFSFSRPSRDCTRLVLWDPLFVSIYSCRQLSIVKPMQISFQKLVAFL